MRSIRVHILAWYAHRYYPADSRPLFAWWVNDNVDRNRFRMTCADVSVEDLNRFCATVHAHIVMEGIVVSGICENEILGSRLI